MAHYDPIYGELLTSRETSDLTGFTLNQLRNHRQRKTSPLPFISDGATSWYRKADVIKYLEKRGDVAREYYVPEGFDPEPLESSEVSIERREHVKAVAKIVTRNAWSKVQEQLTMPDPEFGFKFLEEEMVRLYQLKHGENIRDLYPKDEFAGALDFFLRKNHPNVFWEARTYAVRSLARHTYKWDVTDDDILNVPIGEVPPAKLD